MRDFRETMTIGVGASVSNGVNLESERLAGIRVIEDSDVNTLRFQTLIGGNLGDTASEVWADINLTTGDFPPYTSVPFDIATASIVDNGLIVFPSDKVRNVPSIIRVLNHAAGVPTNVTGVAATFRLLVDTSDPLMS